MKKVSLILKNFFSIRNGWNKSVIISSIGHVIIFTFFVAFAIYVEIEVKNQNEQLPVLLIPAMTLLVTIVLLASFFGIKNRSKENFLEKERYEEKMKKGIEDGTYIEIQEKDMKEYLKFNGKIYEKIM